MEVRVQEHDHPLNHHRLVHSYKKISHLQMKNAWMLNYFTINHHQLIILKNVHTVDVPTSSPMTSVAGKKYEKMFVGFG